MDRDQDVVAIRPAIPIIVEANDNPVEQLMHLSLRPILKFQNDWIIAIIQAQPHFAHLKFHEWEEEKNRNILTQFITKNNATKHLLLGGIISLFTAAELEIYQEHRSDINKRILQMIVTRYVSQI